MFTVAFAKAAIERAVKTFAQTLVALWGAGAFDVLHVDWSQALGVAGGAALLSVLSSVATGAVTDGGPSVGDAEKLDE